MIAEHIKINETADVELFGEAATSPKALIGAKPPAIAVPSSRPVPTPVDLVSTGNWRLKNDPCGANIIGAKMPVAIARAR